MTTRPSLVKLRRNLSRLYYSKERASLIVHDAGINASRILFSDLSDSTWNAILDEAIKSNKMFTLLGMVLDEYGADKELCGAVVEYSIQSLTPDARSLYQEVLAEKETDAVLGLIFENIKELKYGARRPFKVIASTFKDKHKTAQISPEQILSILKQKAVEWILLSESDEEDYYADLAGLALETIANLSVAQDSRESARKFLTTYERDYRQYQGL